MWNETWLQGLEEVRLQKIRHAMLVGGGAGFISKGGFKAVPEGGTQSDLRLDPLLAIVWQQD